MKRQAFQHPEIRDANDNIIQEGTYGKESPLVNGDNTGVLDYINNNLEALHDNINGSRIYVASKAALPTTGDLSAMYIAEDTGKWYLWDGNKYIETDNARKIADEAIAARDAAKASQAAAKTSEQNAKTSETNAAASAKAAATSATNAANSASTAGTQANTAKAWATATTSPDGAADTASTTGKTQSAKSWALYSKDRATASASSASAAASSQAAAKTSENNANASKTAAATSASNAATSANAAANSAKAAADSARVNQADWNVTDTNSKAFIKNKPDVYPRAKTLEIEDTRAQINTPSFFINNYNRRIKSDFKMEDSPEAKTFSSCITITPWDNNTGGYPSQLAFTARGNIFYRIGSSNEEWGNWKRIPLEGETIARATADASGNVITTTYARKDNASITNLTVTGETNVPTANAGNSSKAIANTEFVAKSLAALVNGAPDQLNTLNELAKALGNDSNFAATMTAELAKKLNSTEAESTYLPLSGGTLTGAINTANKTWNKLGDDASFGDYNIGGKMCIKTQTARNTGIVFFDASDTNVGQVEVNNAFDFDKPVKENGGLLVPIGVVQAFAGRTTPQGWLLCDGSAVSRTDYAALYAVIGTTYGKGNGSTTFNLPNLVDKFVEGSATAGTVKSAGLPNITGKLSRYGSAVGYFEIFEGAFSAVDQSNRHNLRAGDDTYNLASGGKFDASQSNSIYGKSTTVQPPALTMRYIIKY